MTHFIVRRIYEPAESNDGYRVLVDRVWPRGMSKERAALNEWAKDIAPSTDLRKWFNHDPEKFAEFTKRYINEVKENPAASYLITNWLKYEKVTLLYGARDEKDNEAVVLQNYLENL